MQISVTPSTATSPAIIAVADLMKSLSILELRQSGKDQTPRLTEVSRHFDTLWSSACAPTGDNEWVVADMEGNLAILKRDPEGVTMDDKQRLQVTGEFRLGEVVNKIIGIPDSGSATASSSGKGKERARTRSSVSEAHNGSRMEVEKLTRSGPIVQAKAFLATIEGAIYMLGTINPSYTDALLRLQTSLASQVQAPGFMPWAKFRAWKTEVRDTADEPFRFVDGEMVEQGLLKLSDRHLETALRQAGLMEGASPVTVQEVRSWGEELRRLY
jgi:DNA damage-binding protein 1